MALSLIGAGFGRTGTLSLKLALEQLGYGPCYHMHNVFELAGHAGLWEQARVDGDADWGKLLAGYTSAVDWPPAYFWRQLREYSPSARVILTVRDPESWYQSINTTIFPAQNRPLAEDETEMNLLMPRRLIRFGTFNDRGNDKDYVLDVYRKHNESVIAEVPAEQLLVYDVSDGWQPLCEFLQVEIPDTAFPRSNTSNDFHRKITDEGIERPPS